MSAQLRSSTLIYLSFKNYIALCCTGEEVAASSNTPAYLVHSEPCSRLL